MSERETKDTHNNIRKIQDRTESRHTTHDSDGTIYIN
jgi:hypothetical protein